MTNNVVDFVKDRIHISKDSPLTIFAGAGVSFDSGIPTVYFIKREILDSLPLTNEHKKELLDLNFPFELFMAIIKSFIPIDGLFPLFNSDTLGIAHQLAGRLFAQNLLKDIYTTNFDTLFESALAKEDRKFSTIKDYRSFKEITRSNTGPRIIKMHGSIEDYESLGITIQKVAEQKYLYKLDPLIRHFCQANNPIIFLGYSMSDYFDIVPLFHRYGKLIQQDLFMVSHRTDDSFSVRKFMDMNTKTMFTSCANAYYVTANTNVLLQALAEKYFGETLPQPNVYANENISQLIRDYFSHKLPDPFDQYKLAASFARQLIKSDSSIFYHEKAHEIGTTDKNKLLSSKLRIIQIQQHQCRVEQSIASIQQIIDDPDATLLLRTRCTLSLASLYVSAKNPQKGAILARKAYKLAIKHKFPYQKYMSLKTLSFAFAAQGFQEKSKSHFILAVKYMIAAGKCRAAADKREQLGIFILTATLWKQLKKNKLANQAYNKAYVIANRFKLYRDMLLIRRRQIDIMKKTEPYWPLRMTRLQECRQLSEKLQDKEKMDYYDKKIEQLKQLMNPVAKE